MSGKALGELSKAIDSGHSLAAAAGKLIARKFFERRGNPSEAHVTELELAALCTLLYAQGLEAMALATVDATRDALKPRTVKP